MAHTYLMQTRYKHPFQSYEEVSDKQCRPAQPEKTETYAPLGLARLTLNDALRMEQTGHEAEPHKFKWPASPSSHSRSVP